MKLLAQYQLLEPKAVVGLQGTSADFTTYFSGISQGIFILGVSLAVLMLAFGGIQYILGDTISSKSEAKSKIIAALTGLALLILMALILETINPNLLKIEISGFGG